VPTNPWLNDSAKETALLRRYSFSE